MNKRSKITFVVLRNSGVKVNQVTCSKQFLICGGVAVMLIFMAFSMLLYDYLQLRHGLTGNQHLKQLMNAQRSEITNQREQIQLFAEEINSLKSKLMELNGFEKKIRMIANIAKPTDGNEGIFGMGGSMPEDLDAKLPIESRHNSLLREMHEQVTNLEVASKQQQIDFKDILGELEEKRNLLASTPSILPAHGSITSEFGYRASPFTGKREMHRGLDIGVEQGAPIFATADGIVSFSGNKGLLGKTVVIDHGHGVSTRYGHCSKILKERGAQVQRGDIIARVGNTGRSTGPHLHYEIQINGIQINPKKYVTDILTAQKENGAVSKHKVRQKKKS